LQGFCTRGETIQLKSSSTKRKQARGEKEKKGKRKGRKGKREKEEKERKGESWEASSRTTSL
jgi:hypothetical protein